MSALEEIRNSGPPITAMAQYSSNFCTWSSSPEAPNLCYKYGNSNNMGSAVSLNMDRSTWQQLEEVTALHYPTGVQIQPPDVLGPAESRYDSSQVLQLQSDYDNVFWDLLNGFPELVSPLDRTNSPVHNRIPTCTRSPPEDVSLDLTYRVEAPVKFRTGRRRRTSESDTPGGWVASKNLISERRRREKLQKGLITLRELVPMFNEKMNKMSILTDAINHLQDLKRKVEMLESTGSNDENRGIDLKSVEVVDKSSCNDLGTTDAGNEGKNRKDSSPSESFCSDIFEDSVVRCDYETSPSSRDWDLHQLDVTKLDHGVYKLDLICMQQSGALVKLSQAIEEFVIEIVHTNMVVITSTKVTCTFVVKMSSWNDMKLEDVSADIKNLLGRFGLHFS